MGKIRLVSQRMVWAEKALNIICEEHSISFSMDIKNLAIKVMTLSYIARYTLCNKNITFPLYIFLADINAYIKNVWQKELDVLGLMKCKNSKYLYFLGVVDFL